jgi:hypothetical protein
MKVGHLHGPIELDASVGVVTDELHGPAKLACGATRIPFHRNLEIGFAAADPFHLGRRRCRSKDVQLDPLVP